MAIVLLLTNETVIHEYSLLLSLLKSEGTIFSDPGVTPPTQHSNKFKFCPLSSL
jgi:hypothetical protein